MDSYSVLEICRAYARLGSAVQDQLDTIVEHGGDLEGADVNLNAAAMIHEFFQRAAGYEDDDSGYEFAGLVESLNQWAEENGLRFEYGRVKTMDGSPAPMFPPGADT